MYQVNCPCCGNPRRSEDPDGLYEICEICDWENDPVQLSDPDFAGGANDISLNKAKENYQKYGVSDPKEGNTMLWKKKDKDRQVFKCVYAGPEIWEQPPVKPQEVERPATSERLIEKGFCANCGAKRGDSRFCTECGEKFQEDADV